MSWGSDLLKDADRSRAYRWITRYTLSRSDVLVGDCQAVQEKAAAFGFPAERSFIFPWGIDLQRFSPAAGDGSDGLDGEPDSAQVFRSRLGWQGAFIALSLRSWEPVYGVDVMLRGFALAAREAPDLRLLMLGGGSQAGLVHQIIRENDLQDRVYLGGQINQADLPKMYRAADLYISASHSDGSSVSLMEALGCGLPVLVTDIPSNREWVVEGQQGWLFPDGDCSAVARGILRALHLAKNTPETFAEIRRASRLRAEQRADWKNNFQVLLQAYQHATGRCDKRHE
jgi:glycosyltransferase involved in cell wall biosynthesis